jgi:hypothetical protein
VGGGEGLPPVPNLTCYWLTLLVGAPVARSVGCSKSARATFPEFSTRTHVAANCGVNELVLESVTRKT